MLLGQMSSNGMTGRTQAFNQGTVGNPTMAATSLGQDSAKFNDQVGKDFTPESVLNQTVPSANGMDQAGYSSRMLSNGSLLPTGNGEDQATMQGDDNLLLDGKAPSGTL